MQKQMLVIPMENIQLHPSLGEVNLVMDAHSRWYVNGKELPTWHMPAPLCGITIKQLVAFLEVGYFRLQKQDGQIQMRMSTRLRGGGPVAGYIGYWATKAICYGAAVAGATAAVVSTGGAAGAATGAVVAASTAGVGTSAAVAGGAIAGAGLATEAAVTTATAVTVAGGAAGFVTAVESTSLGVGVVLTAIPFLP